MSRALQTIPNHVPIGTYTKEGDIEGQFHLRCLVDASAYAFISYDDARAKWQIGRLNSWVDLSDSELLIAKGHHLDSVTATAFVANEQGFKAERERDALQQCLDAREAEEDHHIIDNSQTSTNTWEKLRMKVRAPDTFDGKSGPEKAETFICSMSRYWFAADPHGNMSVDDKIQAMSTYLRTGYEMYLLSSVSKAMSPLMTETKSSMHCPVARAGVAVTVFTFAAV